MGTLADVTCLSFHPVKHITTGEGGMALTGDPGLAEHMRRMRSHGIDLDPNRRAAEGTWRYEMVSLGYNYRITDIQCALGLSQLTRLPGWLRRRTRLAALYQEALADIPASRRSGATRPPRTPGICTSCGWPPTKTAPGRGVYGAAGARHTGQRALHPGLHASLLPTSARLAGPADARSATPPSGKS